MPYPMATVEGTVTYKGKPLTYGRVIFQPEAGTKGPAASSPIGPDGSYRIKTVDRDGVALGWHRVTVHCRRGAIESPGQSKPVLTAPKAEIPRKYSVAEESPLRFEVKEGNNVWRIVLE
jgi:hypothetical protein